MRELKPCPFCGHVAHVAEMKKSVKQRFYVICSNQREECIASEAYVFGKKYPNKEDAIHAWNRRNQERTQKQLEEDTGGT